MNRTPPATVAWSRKQPGWYEAEAAGFRWRIVQTSSRRWEVLCGEGFGYDVVADWPHTLEDAQWFVADAVRVLTDPEYAARKKALRAERAARRAAREVAATE